MSKEGIDCFLLSCRPNDDFFDIENNYGLIGSGVLVRLWQKIYSEKGYYCEWNDRSPVLFLSNWFGGGSGVTLNLIDNVVSRALKIGLLDRKLYEQYKILTSRRLQEQYFDVVKRRKEIKVVKEYLLIDVCNLIGNVNKKIIYVDINGKNVDTFTTSKVKESKGKEKNNTIKSPDVMFREFFELYPKKYGSFAAERAWHELNVDDELFNKIMKALKKFITKNKLTSTQFLPSASRWLSERMWEDVDTVGPDIDEGVIML